MRILFILCSLTVFLLVASGLSACRPMVAVADPPIPEPVWSVDLIRTLPGAQADYVQSIETNWANARRLARTRGAVLSYRAFVASPDSVRGWDVLLMTEYADSTAWADREATFAAIFASPEFVGVEPARPSAEMRVFAEPGVTMRAFVSEPSH
ncbi:MAG: hypothetical protein ABJF88_09455 [Rhodothermales bacterium]